MRIRRLLPPKLFPLLTLLLGYALGNVVLPVSHISLLGCQCHCSESQFAPFPLALDAPSRQGSTATNLNSRVHNSTAVRNPDVATFNSQKYLKPDLKAKHLPARPLGSPRRLSQEYSVRKKLLVAVVTAEQYLLARAKAVYETWGLEVDKILFFVGSDCDTTKAELEKLPIVKLNGIADNVYPPQRKVFAVLKYLAEHYIDQFNWFLRADDDVYVRAEKLEAIIDSLNPDHRVYLGRAGVGKVNDMERIGLLHHERYCMGGPGVVLSNAALRAVTPFLNHCLTAVEQHNKNTQQPWFNEDVELGRCISRTVGVQCSSSAEVCEKATDTHCAHEASWHASWNMLASILASVEY